MLAFNRIQRFLRLPVHERLNRLREVGVSLKTAIYYRRIFRYLGPESRIYRPLMLLNPRYVSVGAKTSIREGARIEAIVLDEAHPPSIEIGNNVNIEQNVHIVCSSRIVIGDNVSITGHCAIVDTVHPFDSVDDPRKIGERIDTRSTPVEIGSNTFIGFGTVILPNVRIGRNCVIGANCTVTNDIPDFSVAVGSPARIVRHFDRSRGEWVR